MDKRLKNRVYYLETIDLNKLSGKPPTKPPDIEDLLCKIDDYHNEYSEVYSFRLIIFMAYNDLVEDIEEKNTM
ncbi:unnamed protein product, partial [marine sediment metagenome]